METPDPTNEGPTTKADLAEARETAKLERVAAQSNPNLMRDLLANERTFLSWLRTAIAITSLGFVVARFDIFLQELTRVSGPAGQQVAERTDQSNVTVPLGVLLVLAGPVVIAIAAARFRHTDSALRDGRLESRHFVRAIIMAITLASFVTGVWLAIHLLVLWPR